MREAMSTNSNHDGSGQDRIWAGDWIETAYPLEDAAEATLGEHSILRAELWSG
jgi:hypothetical protein